MRNNDAVVREGERESCRVLHFVAGQGGERERQPESNKRRDEDKANEATKIVAGLNVANFRFRVSVARGGHVVRAPPRPGMGMGNVNGRTNDGLADWRTSH